MGLLTGFDRCDVDWNGLGSVDWFEFDGLGPLFWRRVSLTGLDRFVVAEVGGLERA